MFEARASACSRSVRAKNSRCCACGTSLGSDDARPGRILSVDFLIGGSEEERSFRGPAREDELILDVEEAPLVLVELKETFDFELEASAPRSSRSSQAALPEAMRPALDD
jgi:hypothetical protein